MRMLMPSHAKNVQPYKDKQPLFQKFQVDQQLDSMFNPTVTLRSGGYVVINPTEALVSIDVNSGRSTKERNIEQTALRTNLEAAEEIARQMRLRDLAGLIVIDFIDMDENRNNKAVERKLKDCLKNDRARIQVGRISHFGLLEMSRQRMRSGVLEGSTVICTMCSGTGLVRSVESMALHVLRGIEAEAIKGREVALTAKVPPEVAIYILNQKRSNILDVEERYGVSIYIESDHDLKGSDHRIEPAEARARTRTRPAVGAINESDVLLATASSAIIIGFNVRPDRNAADVAEREKVDIRHHTVIYHVTDEIKLAMAGLLDPTFKEARIGAATVRETFKVPKIGTIAGCIVNEGVIKRSGDAQARLLRDNVELWSGKIASLKRFKDDVGEVKTGFECGIGLQGYNDLKVGDVIEVFHMERVAQPA